jgi:LruC domain-containing protein
LCIKKQENKKPIDMKSRIYTLLLLAGFFAFAACNKTETPVTPEPEDTIEDLMISDNFDFSTTTDHNITIKLPNSVDYTNYRAKISIYTAPIEEGGILIANVSTNEYGVYQGIVPVPSHIQSLYIVTNAGSRTLTFTNKDTKDGIIDFGDDYSTLPPEEIDGTKSTAIDNLFHEQLASRNNPMGNEKTVNLVVNGDFSENNYGTISVWSSPMTIGQKWYKTSQLNNAQTGYYEDNGNPVLKVTRGTPYYYGGVAQLIEAEQGDVVTFSANYKGEGSSNKRGYLYLIPRNANGHSIGYYSVNTGIIRNTDWGTKTVTATMPAGTKYVQVLFWHHIWGGSLLWDNAVVTGPVQDADNDGVNDEEDEYPNDPARAFNIYFPNSEDFATLGFEDNWPGKGDYDFNDLVIDYQYKQVVNSDNELVDLFGKFVVKAIGASYENGFGFQMGANPNDIASVEGNSIQQNYIDIASNGTEANQSKANIIVFDNAFDIIPHPGGGYVGVNTQPDAPYFTADTMEVTVRFTNPVSQNVNGTAPFNPYIIIDQNRGREAHLSDMEPTDLMDVSYFNTADDNSNPEAGRYYKTSVNLPWGISIPVEFAYPIEKIDITQAHLHFGEWAESSGASYGDWYLEKSGYRNDEMIYQVP